MTAEVSKKSSLVNRRPAIKSLSCTMCLRGLRCWITMRRPKAPLFRRVVLARLDARVSLEGAAGVAQGRRRARASTACRGRSALGGPLQRIHEALLKLVGWRPDITVRQALLNQLSPSVTKQLTLNTC